VAYIISSGESSDGIILNYDSMTVLDGGIATTTTVNSGGWVYVSSGGIATTTTVNSGGWVYVSSGGTATKIHWTPCEGDVWVFDGGYATFASSYSGVYYGEGGKLLSNTAVMDGKSPDWTCRMLVMNNGTATNTNVKNFGTLYIYSGGTGINTILVSGGAEVRNGGTAISTTVGDNGNLYVSSGVAADRITLKFGDDKSDEFAALSGMGAFDAFTSRNIFEESGKGALASL